MTAAGGGAYLPRPGSVEWLHTMVPGAEEIDMFEQLDQERLWESWEETRLPEQIVEILLEMFPDRSATVTDMARLLSRLGPVAGEHAVPTADRAGGESADGPGDDEDAPCLSIGQAAGLLEHLLGARRITEAGGDAAAEPAANPDTADGAGEAEPD